MNDSGKKQINDGKSGTMSNHKDIRFNKIKRIAAMAGVILLAGFYITALVAAIGNWENSHAIFMTAVYLSIAVPVIIYVMMLIHRYSKGKSDKSGENRQ